ncbi:MAG TPA: hypothetical protein VK666_02820 [Chryseolinea sp.]|nr:hypothetical protein [Chryseolinea sp.]
MDIIKIADSKLDAAECLLLNDFIDDAYYLGGYTIELLLKARVCKILGIDNFFEDSFLSKLKNHQAYKIHDLRQLLIFSGLYIAHGHESQDPTFKANWSVILNWNEGHRYMIGKTVTEVKNFLISVKEIATWIKKHL